MIKFAVFFTLVGILAAAIPVSLAAQVNRVAQLSPPLLVTLRDTEKKYSIEVKTAPYQPSSFFKTIARWTPADAADMKNIGLFVPVFIDEWNRYPRGFVAFSGIKSIVLVKRLSYSGVEVGGLADVMAGTLVINLLYARSEDIMRYIIHHEFFHYLDVVKMGGSKGFHNDPEWKKLNPPGFAYSGPGVALLKSGADITALHPRQGFITLYATTAVEEDKAEVFAYLFATQYYRKAEPFITSDQVLKKKFEYMKSVYLRSITREFTDDFFTRLADGARGK